MEPSVPPVTTYVSSRVTGIYQVATCNSPTYLLQMHIRTHAGYF